MGFCDPDSISEDGNRMSTDESEAITFPLQARKRIKRQGAGQAFTFDALQTEDLSSLSMKERELVYEELHGVAKIEHLELETTDFVATKVEELKSAIDQIAPKRRRYYDRATFMNPSLASDAKFYLLFLRAENYDVAAAAERLCTHFQYKVELWGEDKLGKHITLEDLSDDDLYCLRSGGILILPETDSAGRQISLVRSSRYRYVNWKDFYRVMWYQCMSTFMEDHDGHAKGGISVICALGLGDKDHGPGKELSSKGLHYAKNLPRRLYGTHLCYDDSSMRPHLAHFLQLLNKRHRLHMRFHYGSALETQYSMMTFGINIDPQYFSDDDATIQKIMDEYLEDRRGKETVLKAQMDAMVSRGEISYPSPKDVLLGRGRQSHEFPGNVAMRRYVEELAEEYTKAEEFLDKTVLAMTVISKVKDDGGRFLERKDNFWAVAAHAPTVRKVTQVFRSVIQVPR